MFYNIKTCILFSKCLFVATLSRDNSVFVAILPVTTGAVAINTVLFIAILTFLFNFKM